LVGAAARGEECDPRWRCHRQGEVGRGGGRGRGVLRADDPD
jgi:hypothetical protein